ncbi:Alpha/Beta hydrolase protein [Phellopilus nigrolimitatus]|nr:Alpha/Beta hydrolase protein [Phellopilus nigrolimitatus]
MPLITIDEQGHSLFYQDSGVPSNAEQSYTTLIVVHGASFHGGVFRRLIPLAPHHSVRLVLVNRRDYPGSSPYTASDLAQIGVVDAATHEEFLRARGAELPTFIRCFVEREKVPQASPDGKHGGVVLMGWSSGSIYTLSLLSNADTIPAETREAITPFLRSLIIFDPPCSVLGLTVLEHSLDMPQNKSLTPAERTQGFSQYFSEWVGAYYTHASLVSRDVSDLQLAPAAGARIATTLAMSAAETLAVTWPAALERSEVSVRPILAAAYAEQVRRALVDDRLAAYWPRCGVDVVWCENTVWVIVDAVWRLEKLREEADEEGIKGRPFRVMMVPGANHFPHWDEPEATMKFFANVLGNDDKR